MESTTGVWFSAIKEKFMESLAFLVATIFLAVILSGPIALLLSRMGFVVIGAILGTAAILMGGYWACVVPFPASLIGVISLLCGVNALKKKQIKNFSFGKKITEA